MPQRQRLEPVRQKQQTLARFPLPTGGLNFMASTMAMGPDDSYFLDNIIARPTGLEIRKGWRYWVPIANNFPAAVKTVMTFNSAAGTPKLFCSPATAASPIYDVTVSNSAPVLSLTPSTPPTNPGEWYYTNFVTAANNFLCAVAQGAGYYIYSNAGGWVEVVNGSGVGGTNTIAFPDSTSTKDLAYIWVWKNRLWFIKRTSGTVYYLPIGQYAGVAQLFDFGPLLTRGGPLAFGTNWTYDSGDGIDDALVIVSFAGNVIVYTGTDPASAATFSLKGTWYAGRQPAGRRNQGAYGGDIILLTEYGAIRMSDLVSGKLHTTEIGGTIAVKLNPYLSRALSANLNSTYWFVMAYPTDEILIIGSPFVTETTAIPINWTMNSLTGAWNTVSNFDMLCATIFDGQLICGTRTGAVIRGFVGFLDADDAAGSGTGVEVTGRMQGAFLDMGTPNNNKRMLRAKMYGLSDGVPTIFVKFVNEYDLNTTLNVGSPLAISGALWDTALWDAALWQAGQTTYKKWQGVAAYGKKLSLLMAARGAGSTLFTDYEVLFETGIGL